MKWVAYAWALAQSRAFAAESLGGLADEGDAGALAALEKSLADSEANVRQAAAVGLGRLGGPSAARALGAALDDEHADERERSPLDVYLPKGSQALLEQLGETLEQLHERVRTYRELERDLQD